MDYFLTSLWSALETIAFFYICRGIFRSTPPLKRCAITLAILWIASQIYLNLGLNDFLEMLISIVVHLTASCLLYKRKWHLHLLATTLWLVIGGLIDTISLYGFSTLLHLSVSQLMWKKKLYTMIVSTGKLFTLFLSWLFYRFLQRKELQHPQRKWLFLSLLFPFASFIILFMVFLHYQDASDISAPVVLFCVILAIANVGVAYFTEEMEKSAQREKELVLLHQEMELQTSHILDLEKGYKSQRMATHEFRSQLQTILGLLSQGKTEDANNYVQVILGRQTARIFPVNSHHSLIDALLNQKFQLAKEHDIDIHFEVNNLSKLSLDIDKMIVLLSNLLDNAIEGCCRVESQRVLDCRIIAVEDCLQLSVRNSSLPVSILGNSIPTSKTPKEEHGFGIPKIQHIVKQFHGTCMFDYQRGWFAFVAELPIEPAE